MKPMLELYLSKVVVGFFCALLQFSRFVQFLLQTLILLLDSPFKLLQPSASHTCSPQLLHAITSLTQCGVCYYRCQLCIFRDLPACASFRLSAHPCEGQVVPSIG